MNRAKKTDRWYGGRLLAFSGLDGLTDFYHGLTARTSLADFSLEIKLPGESEIQLPWVNTPEGALRGDSFDLTDGFSHIRGAFLDAHHLLIEGACCIKEPLDPNLVALFSGERLLIGSAARFTPDLLDSDLDAALTARRAWVESAWLPPNLPDQAEGIARSALSQIKTMVYAPEGMIHRRFTTPDRWPHRGMWLWDSAFHAIGIRHFDPALAREILEAVFDGQKPDGMVPIRTDPGESHAVFTQPPVLALATAMIEEIQTDPAWLEQMYPRLSGYIRWDLEHRDSDGAGLAEWAIEEFENCRSGESGWDNSPRFDAAVQLDAVDFNSFLALECELLAGFAARLNKPAESLHWAETHRSLCAQINARLWDKTLGFYVDYDTQNRRQSPVLAASGFLPLICGAASQAQAIHLVEHLRDPMMFGAPFPVPTVAVRDTAHYAKDMWRGPVWINVNWLIEYGLARYGFVREAENLREKTLAEIEKYFRKYGTFFEFYDDRQELPPPQLQRKGKLAPHVSPFHQVFFDYGWTAALYLDWIYRRNPVS